MATIVASPAGGNWNATTAWVGGVVPTAADDVNAILTSGNLTIPAGYTAVCRSFDSTGHTGSLSWSNSSTAFLLIGDGSGGSCTFGASSGLTGFSGVSNGLQFVSTSNNGGAGWAITTNGKVLPPTTFGGVAAVTGGKWVLQDAMTVTASGSGLLRHSAGTLDTNSMSLTAWKMSVTGSAARTLTLRSSVITLTGGASAFDATTVTNLTVTANTATINFTGSVSGTNAGMIGGGKDWNGLNVAFSGPGTTTNTAMTVAGLSRTGVVGGNHTSSGVANLGAVSIAPGRALTLPASTTTTVTDWSGTVGTKWPYVYFPGGSGNYASVPDSAALSITGDIWIQARIAPDDWTPGAFVGLVNKAGTAPQQSYSFALNAAGTLAFFVSSDGTAIPGVNSTVAPTIADGQPLWVAVARRQSDGRVQFFTADGSIADPVMSDFTQLGTNLTLLSGSAIADSTAPVNIGSTSGTVSLLTGKMYRAKIYAGLDSTGTLALDADFVNKPFGANTFAEGSVNAATVTLNGLAQAGDGRVAVLSSVSGTPATLSKASGVVTSGYLKITDVTASGATWYAGRSSVDNGGNTGWIFADYFTVSLSDSAPATDSLARGFSSPRALADSAPATDVVTRAALGVSRAVADSALATDTLAARLTASRALADAVTATDAVLASFTGLRLLSDTASASDTVARALLTARALSEVLTTTDAVSFIQQVSRSLTDSAPATDTLTRAIGFARSLADSAGATDVLTWLFFTLVVHRLKFWDGTDWVWHPMKASDDDPDLVRPMYYHDPSLGSWRQIQ